MNFLMDPYLLKMYQAAKMHTSNIMGFDMCFISMIFFAAGICFAL